MEAGIRRCIATRAVELLAQVGMQDAADRPSRELAYGDVKRVELAIALANDPRLLLMDEPTAGMAPKERNDLIALVKRLVIEKGISVLFTEHSMDVVFAFADRIIVLARGRLIADGDAEVDPRQSAGAGKCISAPARPSRNRRPTDECPDALGRKSRRVLRRRADPLRPQPSMSGAARWSH